MTDKQIKPGFMPRQVTVTSLPLSYAIRSYGRPPRLNLEQVWEKQEQKAEPPVRKAE